MNEQEIQQAFVLWLAQKLGVNSQEELESAIQLMGEEGLRQAYNLFMLEVLQRQVQAARFGAKLNYIKQLRGLCPPGYEMSYFKKGGRLCKECKKKLDAEKKGGTVSEKPYTVDDFKKEYKQKKK